MIGSLSSAGAGHVLDYDCRVPWNMSAQGRDNGPYAQICGAARVGGGDHGDRLVLIERSLSGRRARPEEPAPESAGADQDTVNISVFQSRLPSRFTDPCANLSGSEVLVDC